MEAPRLKIGLFVDVFFPMVDGVAVVVDNYAKRLAKTMDVTVFCPKARSRDYVDHFPYRVIRCRKIPLPKSDYDVSLPLIDPFFAKQLIESRLDIVHIHSPFFIGQVGIEYAKVYKIPVVATIHSQYQRDFLQKTKSRWLAKIGVEGVAAIFNACDECWAVNRTIAELYRGFGIKKPLRVQNNATDLVPLPPDDDTDLRLKYGIREGESVLLFVGRIDPIKNIYFSLEVIEKIRDSGWPFKMLFVGSGPAMSDFETRIRDKGLQDTVRMVGRIIDRVELARHYRLADLFLFPSLYDASSLVQIEAASQGTPSIFIEGAATADTVTDRVNGFLAPNDSEGFSRAVLTILKDKGLLAEVSRALIEICINLGIKQ
jgi:glycosyltransferase involved in cell wall biosynthesis